MKDSSIKLNQQSKTEILSALDGQPPKLPCIEVPTPDQIQRLRIVREHFQSIKAAIEASVSEQENPITDPLEKKFVDREVEYYLAIYNLLRIGWSAIESEIRSQYPESGNLLSPGDTFAYVIELDCEAMLSTAVQSGSVSSREAQILLAGLPDIEQASGERKKRVARTLEYAKSVRDRGTGSGNLLAFCENAIAKRLRGNPTLKRQLEAFKATRNSRIKKLKTLLKAQGILGEKWLDGQKLFL